MRRRRSVARRNPSLSDVNTLLVVGVAGVALYLVYKLVTTGRQAVTQAATAVSKALVPFPTASATIVLSDGTEIPYSAVTWRRWIGWFNTLDQFDYNGVGYQLLSNQPDETNTYYASIIASELTPATPALSPALQSYQDQINAMTAGG